LSGFSSLGATVDLFAILASPIFDFDKKRTTKTKDKIKTVHINSNIIGILFFVEILVAALSSGL
jgi:hypothetical protein